MNRHHKIFIVLAVSVVALFASMTRACLWDRDTLRDETAGKGDVVDAITGWFDRNPPLYYEMRLKRSAALLEKEPTNLDAYDDAGVACDRLGRSDEAIAWMEKKHAQLEALDAKDATARDHTYRYLANIGTFWVHRWFRAGADCGQLADVEKARDFVASAIALNPDAHFGREKYQLKVLEWIIKPPEWGDIRDFVTGIGPPDCIGLIDPNRTGSTGPYNFRPSDLKQLGMEDADRGLSGLIVLGNAWESVDIYYAMLLVLHAQRKAAMVQLAQRRVEELLAAGKKPLMASPAYMEEAARRHPWKAQDQEIIDQFYKDARAAADARAKSREAFIMVRLQAGRHPDTDTNFWDGYSEPPRVSLPGKWKRFFSGGWRHPQTYSQYLIGFSIVGAVGAVALKVTLELRRRGKQRAQATE